MSFTLLPEFKLYENIHIETNLLSPDYDGVVLILYPKEKNSTLPQHIGSFVDNVSRIDKYIYKTPTLWNCDYVSGGRLVLAPTGPITPYHDAKVLYDAAKTGIKRAIDAGIKKPLLVVQDVNDYPDNQLTIILGAFEALYVPLQIREMNQGMLKFQRLGLLAEEKFTESFERLVRNAIALERSRIFARDIAGGDPERMTPMKVEEYVKEVFSRHHNISIKVINDEAVIEKEYPLLAAVSRAANTVERHKARIIELEYKPSDISRVAETLILIGKGVTYDTGGADIKISGKMVGMSRDKSGAAAVAGFLKACSILKPQHLKVIGVLCLCRNSVGEDCYVADELIKSRSGKTVRVMNTDAEGRFAMADSVYKWSQIAENELNPHIYTIATLTGHVRLCYGECTAAMDNYSAKATNHANKLQFSGSRIGEPMEVSTLRPEDMDCNNGKIDGDDLVQLDMDKRVRNHQMAAGFLIRAGGLEDKNIKYTHLDIAGGAGQPPNQPTAVPLLSLCHLHKVFL